MNKLKVKLYYENNIIGKASNLDTEELKAYMKKMYKKLE